MRTLLITAIASTFCCAGLATDFYIAPSGNDANPGARQRPWRSIERANRQSFHAGDRLLFEGGKTFTGTLALAEDDSGATDRPVVITSYGNGRANVDGGSGKAVTVTGARWLELRNLKLTGAGRKTGNHDSGLVISGGSDIKVDDVDVSGFQRSGIAIDGVDRLRLTHAYTHENGFAGISAGGRTSHDLYIGYSLAENNPGDPTVRSNHSGNGIVIGQVRRGMIEYSEARYNGWDMPWTGNGPVGIWAYESDRVTIQYCVAHDNRSTATDGGGFDFDGGMTNSVLQYNYSHGNFGTGYLICQYDGAGLFADNVVRYNISQDDGLLAHNAGIYVWVGGSGMKSTLVHNNTIFNTKGSAVAFGVSPKYASELPKMTFYNNIFVSRMAQIVGGAEKGQFVGNIYFAMGERGFEVDGYKDFAKWARATGQEMVDGVVVGKFVDPGLRKDGSALISSPADLPKLHEYKLLPDSPAIGAGVDLRKQFNIDPGPYDLFGNPTGRDVGAAESSAKMAGRRPR